MAVTMAAMERDWMWGVRLPSRGKSLKTWRRALTQRGAGHAVAGFQSMGRWSRV